jgi:hypothetical protein
MLFVVKSSCPAFILYLIVVVVVVVAENLEASQGALL